MGTKKQRRRWRTVLLVSTAVVVLLVAVGGLVLRRIDRELRRLTGVTLADVDLTAVPDGEYTGVYQVFPVRAKVVVHVKGRRISAIDLVEHRTGQGKPAEALPDRVVAAQSLQVAAVSGATYSSKVILKAIENALASAQAGVKQPAGA